MHAHMVLFIWLKPAEPLRSLNFSAAWFISLVVGWPHCPPPFFLPLFLLSSHFSCMWFSFSSFASPKFMETWMSCHLQLPWIYSPARGKLNVIPGMLSTGALSRKETDKVDVHFWRNNLYQTFLILTFFIKSWTVDSSGRKTVWTNDRIIVMTREKSSVNNNWTAFFFFFFFCDYVAKMWCWM